MFLVSIGHHHDGNITFKDLADKFFWNKTYKVVEAASQDYVATLLDPPL